MAACSEFPSWSGVANGASVPTNMTDCRTNTTDVVQSIYTDPANEVVYISMNGSHLTTQSWPFTAYKPECTPDDYGYCLDSVSRNLTRQTCYTPDGLRSAELLGTITNNVYSAADGADTSFTEYIYDDGSGSCMTEAAWSPGEPNVVYGDPNLP